MPRVLLTRPRAKSEALAAALARDGWEAAIWPVLEMRDREIDRRAVAAARTLIFTSARAAEALAPLAPLNKPAWCVGPATARAAEAIGCAPRDGGGDAAEMLARILAGPDEGPYLHLRGAQVRVRVAAALDEAGRRAAEAVAYEAAPGGPPPAQVDTLMRAGKIDAVALFSPRSAEIFAAGAPASWRAAFGAMRAVAISPATAAPLRPLGFATVEIAEKPEGAAMRAAICGAAP